MWKGSLGVLRVALVYHLVLMKVSMYSQTWGTFFFVWTIVGDTVKLNVLLEKSNNV